MAYCRCVCVLTIAGVARAASQNPMSAWGYDSPQQEADAMVVDNFLNPTTEPVELIPDDPYYDVMHSWPVSMGKYCATSSKPPSRKIASAKGATLDECKR